MRALVFVISAFSVLGCARGARGVVRTMDGTPTVGRAISSEGYASAVRLALHAHGLRAGDGRTLATRAVEANPGDDVVLAMAVLVAGDDARIRAAAEARRGHACAVDTALTLHATQPAAAARVLALVVACPESAALALEAATQAEDHGLAQAIRTRTAGAESPDLRSATLDALVRENAPEELERFVAANRDDARLVAEARRRAETAPAPLAAALLAPLSDRDEVVAAALSALVRADRRQDARRLLESEAMQPDAMARLPLADRLTLAECALALDLAELARTLAHDAFADGASTRAVAVEIRALEALGRSTEAETLRSTLAPGTSGRLALEPAPGEARATAP